VAGHDISASTFLLERSISWSRLSAEQTVEMLESIFSPDNKAANVSTRSKLKKVECIHRAKLDTRKVAETLDKTGVVLVADEWTTTHGVAAVTPLTTTSAELLGGSTLLNIIVSTDSLKDLNGGLGLVNGLNVVGNNKWYLRKLADLVATSLDKSWEGGSSES
jgi:hypothetical protein